MNLKQNELDIAEEYLLNRLFGNAQNPVISKKIEALLILKGIDYRQKINEYILLFEEFAKDLQKENGMFDGTKTTKLLTLQFPQMQGLNLPDIRPVEVVRIIDNLIGLEKLGKLIQL